MSVHLVQNSTSEKIEKKSQTIHLTHIYSTSLTTYQLVRKFVLSSSHYIVE